MLISAMDELASLQESACKIALERFRIIQPCLEEDRSLSVIARKSAARLEAAEQRLPETLDPESLRKYFTLTETDLQELAVCRGVVT